MEEHVGEDDSFLDYVHIELSFVCAKVESLKTIMDFDFGEEMPYTIGVIKNALFIECILGLCRMGDDCKDLKKQSTVSLGHENLCKSWNKIRIARNQILGHNGDGNKEIRRYKHSNGTYTIDYSFLHQITIKDFEILINEFTEILNNKNKSDSYLACIPLQHEIYQLSLFEITKLIKKAMLYNSFKLKNDSILDISEQGHDYATFVKLLENI